MQDSRLFVSHRRPRLKECAQLGLKKRLGFRVGLYYVCKTLCFTICVLNRLRPPPPPPAPAGVLGTALGPVRQIVASSAAFVAIHDNGQVGVVFQTLFSLEVGTCSLMANLGLSFQVFGWGEDCEPSSAARGRLESASVASVACSGKAFAALTEDGEVICWGDEIFGGNPKESCGGAAVADT